MDEVARKRGVDPLSPKVIGSMVETAIRVGNYGLALMSFLPGEAVG